MNSSTCSKLVEKKKLPIPLSKKRLGYLLLGDLMAFIIFLLFFSSCNDSAIIAERVPASDSLFFKSFNLRYKNPNEGIRLAEELVAIEPQKAYLSMAYNYFYQSNYNSSIAYLDKAFREDPNNWLIKSLVQSCQGFIEQRLGNYYKAYQLFDSAGSFYYKNINRGKCNNDTLFSHGFVINSLGNITFQYYYIKDFNEIKKELDFLDNIIKKEKLPISNDLKAHIQYLYLLNYTDNLDSINEKNGFYSHIDTFIEYIDTSNYYLAGNLFEILGLSFQRKDFNDSLKNYYSENDGITRIIDSIVKFDANPKLGFHKKSLKFYLKHGDPYQIAGAYYHIAEQYSNSIKYINKNNTLLRKSIADSTHENLQMAFVFFHAGDSKYFDTIFNKKVNSKNTVKIESLINKLISLPWYIHALKLRHYAAGIKEFDTSIDTYSNIDLFRNLEKRDTKNINSFYTKLKETQEVMLYSERRRNLNSSLWIASISALFFIFLLVVLYLRRQKRVSELKVARDKLNAEIQAKNEIQETKVRLEDLNKLNYEIATIKEDLLKDEKRLLRESLNPLNSLLRKLFDAEYCAIGFVEEENDKSFVKDIAFEFSYVLSEEQIAKKRELLQLEQKDSIIGKFLKSQDDYKQIFGENTEIKKSVNLREYKQLIQSKSIKSIHLAGIYTIKDQLKIPIGYISIINPLKYSQNLKECLIQLSSHISRMIENEENRRQLRYKKKDESFISEISRKKIGINEIISKTLDYLSEEFDAGIISFRAPVINGPDKESENNLLFVLSGFKINDQKINNHDLIKSFYYNKKKTLELKNITNKFQEELFKNFPDNILFDKHGQDEHFLDQFNLRTVFRTKENIIVPIRKEEYKTPNGKDNSVSPYWKSLYGLFNLQLFEIRNREEIKERLVFIAMGISGILNDNFSKQKIRQITVLGNEISNLTATTTFENSMQQIAKLVSKALNAMTCSIFLENKNNDRLEIKATNAEVIIHSENRINICKSSDFENMYFDCNDEKSVTARSFRTGSIFMIYDLELYKTYSKKIIEIITDEQNVELGMHNYVWLIIPLKNRNHKIIGVLKCSGIKTTKNNLLHTFWDFDLEILEFVSALAYALIVDAQHDFEKDNFLKHVIHEFKSPINEMLLKSESFYNRMVRNKQLTNDYTSFYKSLTNIIMLQKSILRNVKDVTQPIILSLELTDVNEILIHVVQLLEETAHFENSISIKTNISKMPLMLVDKYRMEQVFINLLMNAINYSKLGSEINIYYKSVEESILDKPAKQYHEIKFVNLGIGFKDAEKEDVFRRYYRGSNTVALKTSGMGIGLFLVREIIRTHGGDCIIRKASNPTEISVLIPNKN